MALAINMAQAGLSKLFKTVYLNRDLSNQSQNVTPAYDMVAKLDSFQGSKTVIPFNQDLPGGVASTKANARLAGHVSTFDNWELTDPKTLFRTLPIDTLSIKRSASDIGAFLRLKQKEMDESIIDFKTVLGGIAFWGDGSGCIGEIAGTAAAISAGAGVTVTLLNVADTAHYHLKQNLEFAAARTSGGLRTATAVVTAVNRMTGVITITLTGADLNTATGAGVPGDFVYNKGQRNSLPLGIQAFIPAADPTTTLLGLTRTDDPVMKGGWRFSSQGSIEETCKYAVANMSRFFNRRSSIFWVSPLNWFKLEQELSAVGKVTYDNRTEKYFGSTAIMMNTSQGPIPVMMDPFCPSDAGYILDMSVIEVHKVDNLIHLVEDDGLSSLRDNTEDGVEYALRSYSENLVRQPYRCARIEIL